MEIEEMEIEGELQVDEPTLSQWLQQNKSNSRISLSLYLSPDDNRGLDLEASALVDGIFYVDQNMGEFKEALKNNTETKIVELCLDGDWSCDGLLTTALDDLIALLRLLSDNESLNGLTLDGGTGDAAVLSRVVQFAQHLETIEFYEVRLTGNEDSFDILARSLRVHPALKEVNSFYLKIDNDTSSGTKMDQLLEAILQSQTIAALGIWTTPKPEEELFATRVLLEAFSSTKLTTLQLIGVFTAHNLQDDVVARLVQQLGSNRLLRCLQLSLDLSEDSCSALARLIQSNSVLESIRINTTQDPMTIRHNQEHILKLASALEHNNTLTKFKLVAEMNAVQLDEEVLGAFESLLQRNYTLQDVVLPGCDHDHQDILDFYLRLNRSNRQETLCTSFNDTDRWLRQVSTENELDAVFFHFSMNPSIFAAFPHCLQQF